MRHGMPQRQQAGRNKPEWDLCSASVAQFRGSDGATLSIDHPVSKAAILYLAEVWPQVVPFSTLLSAARARLATAVPEARSGTECPAAPPDASELDSRVLGANLMMAYSYSDKLVDLHAYASPIASEVGDCPMASHVARFQAGHTNDRVTNLRHERVSLDEADRYLLSYLDGSHDRRALVDSAPGGAGSEGHSSRAGGWQAGQGPPQSPASAGRGPGEQAILAGKRRFADQPARPIAALDRRESWTVV